MLDERISERCQWKDPINITKEEWMSLLKDREIITEEDMQLLTLLYANHGYRATATELLGLLNRHVKEGGKPVRSLNRRVGYLGERIVRKLNIPAPEQKRREGYWWKVPFWGEDRKEGIYWILRPELAEAMHELHDRGEILVGYGANLPEEVDLKSQENLYEGARKQISVNSYERDDRARSLCIAKYGTKCVICGFDFEKVYGEVGRNFIHVHHLIPLSEIKQEYKVDPEEHLRPVCPNCHAIIHKKTPPYSIDEVVAMIVSDNQKMRR